MSQMLAEELAEADDTDTKSGGLVDPILFQ